jgi:hypothetical protein
VSDVQPGEVVKPLPFSKCLFKVDVAFIAKQPIEFLLTGPVWSLDFPIQLRRTRFDIGIPVAPVLDVPVELGLDSWPLSVRISR